MISPAAEHYRLLAVAESDDLGKVTRAYRRLAKQFHPDISTLPKREAEAKFGAIAEAYRLIRIAKTNRLTPDQYPGRAWDYNGSPNTGTDGSVSWTEICAQVPEAAKLWRHLAKISKEAADEFRRAAIYDHSSDWLVELAGILEHEYIARYFGPNQEIRRFAKWLVFSGYISAARDLNRSMISGNIQNDAEDFIREFVRSRNLEYLARKDGKFEDVVEFTGNALLAGMSYAAALACSFSGGVLAASIFGDVSRGIERVFVVAFFAGSGILALLAPRLIRLCRGRELR